MNIDHDGLQIRTSEALRRIISSSIMRKSKAFWKYIYGKKTVKEILTVLHSVVSFQGHHELILEICAISCRCPTNYGRQLSYSF